MMPPRRFYGIAFMMLALAIVSGLTDTSFYPTTTAASAELTSSPASQYPFILLDAVLIVWMAPRLNIYLRQSRRIWFLWLFVGLACASASWSLAPALTIRRGIALAGTTLLGCFLYAHHDLKRQVELLCWTTAILTVLSLLVVVFFPDFGINGEDLYYGWCGVFATKNQLGIVTALCILSCFLTMQEAGAWRRFSAFGMALATLLLWKTESRSSQLACAATVLAYPVFRLIQRQNPKIAALTFLLMLASLGGAILALVIHIESVLPSLGRSITLTGRTEIWAEAIRNIMDRPLLGYGFDAFWAWRNSAHYTPGFEAPHSHCGYLDLFIDMGAAGFAVFMAGFAAVYIRAFLYARAHTNPTAQWPLLFLTWLALFNLVEGHLTDRNSVYWTLYVAAALTVSARENPETGGEMERPPG